jgi:hypothetical protein
MATPRCRLFAALAAALLGSTLALGAVTTASANSSVEAAEALARNTFYEGVPPEDAQALEPTGVERLIEMLGDPDEAPYHAQILEVLGMTGRREVYAAVSAAAAEESVGEVDRGERRKRVARLVALGHLARQDDRALADLQAAAQAETAAKPKSRRAVRRDEHLHGLLRRSAVSALANSGRAEAHSTLRSLATKADDDPEFERHLRSAIRRLERQQSRASGSGARGKARGRGVER